jgi:hypothetical protein
MEEAVEWARRCPNPMPGEESELEIRPVFEVEDFGEEFDPELRAQEERLRREIDQLQASRARARAGPGGTPVLLFDQDRAKWIAS